MEDLSDILKKRFLGLYKQKPESQTLQDRVTIRKVHRKMNRADEMIAKRKIPLNSSPYITPLPIRRKSPIKKVQTTNKRLEMLAKWKAEKEREKMADKAKSKSVFKVSAKVELPKLENVNFEIKGRPFKSSFAPDNHEFKPPANITSIQLGSTLNLSTKKRETVAVRHRMTTRSQSNVNICDAKTPKIQVTRAREVKSATEIKKKQNNKPVSDLKKVCKSANKSTKATPKKEKSSNLETDSHLNPVSPLRDSNLEKTPEKKDPPVYISPFVTISRGKDSARKEYSARKSGLFSEKRDSLKSTSPKAGAAYFSWLLNTEISRLQKICGLWVEQKELNNLAEEAIAMIDVALGQTNLLITKKFEQFRGLIDKCNENNTETPVTCEDLHGFWDMMHLQIENIEKRFENLKQLKDNNWEEILPQVKKQSKKVVKTKKNVKASAGLRAAIEAARRKKEEESQKKTPNVSKRLSLVKCEGRKSSPGLTMLKVSQFAKTYETPGKSILKSAQKGGKGHSKSVLFIDDVENDVNTTNVQSEEKTPRRSKRLSRSKLF